MATVPIIDTPQQELGAGGFQPFAAPGVEPMKNFAPEQMIKQGQAIQAAGQTMMKVGDQIQDQIDDANTKAADSFFTARAQKILLDPEGGYMNTIGVQAKDKYQSVKDELTKARDEALQTLTSPRQQQMFERVAQRHMLTFNSQIDQHAVKQIRVYAAGESEAREQRYVDMAIADPTRRNEYMGVAIAEANQRADLFQLPADSSQRAQMVQKATTAVHTGVTTELILANKFTDAKSYLDTAFKAEQIDAKSYRTLSVQIDQGYRREQGTAAGDRIFATRGGPAQSDPGSVIDWVIGVEGGYVADDAGKGPTKFGINGKANGLSPEKVANLTMDEARAIYKKNYWDKIGADKLPPELRAIAFDTAVNQGPAMAEKLIQQSGGDPQKFIDLRRAEYQKLVASNPGKWQQYEKGWMNRLDKLEAGLGGKTSSLSSLLAETETIADPQERDIARARIKSKWAEDEAVRTQDYQEKLTKAQDIAYQREGGWSDIPATLWADLKQSDRAQLMNRPKTSDSNTLLMLQNNPELWAPGKIEKYRGLLSESDYRSFYTKGSGPDGQQKILAATVDNEQFKDALLKAGLKDLAMPKEKSKDAEEQIRLRAQFEREINAEQIAKKRLLTMDEKNALLTKILKPVKVKMVYTSGPMSWIGKGETTGEKRFYQVENRANIIIPDDTRAEIIFDLNKRGLPTTPDIILNAYLAKQEITK